MNIKMHLSLVILAFSLPAEALAPRTEVLADVFFLKAVNAEILSVEESLGVGHALLTREQQEQLTELAHDYGKCGGFEALEASPEILRNELALLKNKVERDSRWSQLSIARLSLMRNTKIQMALQDLKAENLRTNVRWLSAFSNRSSRAQEPNEHVYLLRERLTEQLKEFPWAQISLIDHTTTRQKTLRVRLVGKSLPEEVIVLGGHLDSTAGWSGSIAPGADDNASGSSNLLETLRVLVKQDQPDRSIEFFWYAGEEAGLLGSAQIARSYKERNINVVAVLQLDMTLFPGSGELTIANISDYTSSWLRDVLAELNDLYVGARMIDDKCGYGCSDHASWYRQGFPTALPFEAAVRSMNRNIHTARDLISDQSNFEHSLAFSKLALALAMELGNSNLRQPY